MALQYTSQRAPPKMLGKIQKRNISIEEEPVIITKNSTPTGICLGGLDNSSLFTVPDLLPARYISPNRRGHYRLGNIK